MKRGRFHPVFRIFQANREKRIMSQAFISFCFKDIQTVRAVVKELQENYDITCWFCNMEVPYGESYKNRIILAIQDAQTVVLFHSQHAAGSDNVKQEIGIAKNENRYVIPCKLDHTAYQGELYYDLVNDNYLEAVGISHEDFVRKLSNEIKRVILGKIAPERNTYKLSSYRTTRNEVFLGRETVLADIHKAFDGRNIVFLHGMGGIGKTEIAQNYAKTYENDYKTIVFARYESSLAALLANDTVFDVKGLQRKTKADNTLQTDEEYARDKMAILKKICDTDTLVIIDNFDVNHDQDPLFHELVKDVPFRVLFTTRNRPSANYFTVPVSHLIDTDLKKVFLAHMGASFVEEDDPDFPALFDMVEHHTLSVILLAKYADRISVDYVSELIQELKNQGFSALSEVSNGRLNGYESIKNLIRMARLTEEQAYFLRCLAIMPPQGVPWNMFMEWCSAYGERNGLIKLGYVDYDREHKIIRMHPVIREVVWNEMEPGYENCKNFIESCTFVGDEIISRIYHLDSQTRVNYTDCYNAIVAFLRTITKENYLVFRNIVSFFTNENMFDNTLQQELHDFCHKNFGYSSEERYDSLRFLAAKADYEFLHVSKIMGKEDQAYDSYTLNKEIADWIIEKKDYTSRWKITAIRRACDKMIQLYKNTSDKLFLDEARFYYAETKKYGQDFLNFAKENNFPDLRVLEYRVKYNRLSELYFLLLFREFDKALDVANDLVGYTEEMARQNLPYSPLDIANRKKDIAKIYRETGRYEEAIKYLDETRKIYLAYYPEDHHYIIRLTEAYIKCYIKQADYDKASILITELEMKANKKYAKNHEVYQRILTYKSIISYQKKETPPCSSTVTTKP